jgi:hypothetical protein
MGAAIATTVVVVSTAAYADAASPFDQYLVKSAASISRKREGVIAEGAM